MNVLDRFKAAMRVFRTKEATASRTLTLNELLDWLGIDPNRCHKTLHDRKPHTAPFLSSGGI